MTNKPIRVLEVVGYMDRGGIETWLMHVLRKVDRSEIAIDFMVETTEEKTFDAEIRSLGAKILANPYTKQPLKYAQRFIELMDEHGPYDVIHSHIHHYSGYVLALARLKGIPMRIAHSHNDSSKEDQNSSFARQTYLNLMKWLIKQNATKEVSASGLAAKALFGDNWKRNPDHKIVYCGVDMTAFEKAPTEMQSLRKELNIPPDAFVVGHVGRFFKQKNHTFLIDIAAEVVKLEPDTIFLLVGDGPLRPKIEEKARSLGIQDHVIFAGVRSDIPQLMKGVMDVYLFPSLHEGLPLVGMEAQAAGLPLILSDSITSEIETVDKLIHFMSLKQSPSEWAKKVVSFKRSNGYVSRDEALRLMQRSPFNVDVSAQQLIEIYCG